MKSKTALTLAQRTNLLKKETIKALKNRLGRHIGRAERTIDYIFSHLVSNAPEGVPYILSQVLGVDENSILDDSTIFVEGEKGLEVYTYSYTINKEENNVTS